MSKDSSVRLRLSSEDQCRHNHQATFDALALAGLWRGPGFLAGAQRSLLPSPSEKIGLYRRACIAHISGYLMSLFT
jgi:hypothetical protein